MRKILINITVIYFSIVSSAFVFAANVNVVHGWPAQQGEAFEKVVNAFKGKHPDIEVIVDELQAFDIKNTIAFDTACVYVSLVGSDTGSIGDVFQVSGKYIRLRLVDDLCRSFRRRPVYL
jgi:hypothetical protein